MPTKGKPRKPPQLHPREIRASFADSTIEVTLDQLMPTKVVDPKVLKTHKYRQIVTSIRSIGVIEPPAVSPAESSRYFIRDGHLRVMALKELGEKSVTCLIALDDETYTYNKQLSRMPAIQEHKMIRRAIDKGVPEEQLSEVLNLDIRKIAEIRNLLMGICTEAADLLKDKFVAPKVFPILRKMTALRQIETATLMRDADTYTTTYAKALLAATPKAQLVHPDQPKKIKGLDDAQMARMESEMEGLKREFRLVEETYGRDVLNLTLARGYLGTLLGNTRIVRYLGLHQPEMLRQFQKVSDMANLSPTAADGPQM